MDDDLLADLPGRRLDRESLAEHTWYRVGGPAQVFFTPADTESLTETLRRARQAGLPLLVLGQGANLLVSDQGFSGVVLSLADCCAELEVEDNLLRCGAGAELDAVVRRAEQAGLAGLADLSGIPGTVGGALRMNAGAFGTEIGDRVAWVEGLDSDQRLLRLGRGEIGFGYRTARGLGELVLLRCELELAAGEPGELAARRKEILEQRAAKQPLACPSCGSVFKRPPGDYAGRLIEAAGCKGLRRGGAVVSDKHANFILNEDGATAADIRWLIDEVRQRVLEHSGVELQTEVILVGFADD